MNWKTTNINQERSLNSVNWKALEEYAIKVKRKYSGNYNDEITCRLSAEYSMGGLNVVRRLDFHDATSWVARLQLHESTPESLQRLVHEVHTIQVVRDRSKIPVPEVFAYEANCSNAVGVAFMIMESIPGDTAMDSFGGWCEHRGRTPPHFKDKFHTTMAEIQVEMASIRFPKIGSIIQLSDGTYSVGPIPGVGGPFDSAAEFFRAWAKQAKYPYKDKIVRERTPPELVNEILISIREFPFQLANFTKRYCFQEGPFPLFHTDLYKSNILIDSEYGVLSVIDWENAIVAPWEIVEFIKDLCIVPPVMNGPLYHEDDADRQVLAERGRYIEMVRKAEKARQLDSKLSTVLGNWSAQNLAHAIWLYLDGRIGFYTHVFELFE
ncbi:hypothetical protein K469DRAFT_669624 [Zopfia rhizophila CBS 207.26]|uniref:Aminoglycoside phosphotransferase domain-containing protein n=1 Tax=Zopfia rhizophila CBS 207.26 TaxID=1314779 RepID=A0A6A6DSN6_9PEZI|nr:hypothetical protein K469DRAFT_669624 [Zopfia rhizophila CBS 207.26]